MGSESLQCEVHVLGMETCKDTNFPLPVTLKGLIQSSTYYILDNTNTGEFSKVAKFSEFAAIRVHEIMITHTDTVTPTSMMSAIMAEVLLKFTNNLPNSTIKHADIIIGDRCYIVEDHKFKCYFGLMVEL